MNKADIRTLLQKVESKEIGVEAALKEIEDLPPQ